MTMSNETVTGNDSNDDHNNGNSIGKGSINYVRMLCVDIYCLYDLRWQQEIFAN